MTTLAGSCLCGAVKYEVHGGVDDITYCHCAMCRKAHGWHTVEGEVPIHDEFPPRK
jgi:hypothetical protein